MLEKLSKNNNEWIKIATQICGNKDNANDLVQEMYLKLHNINKEINVGYIYFTIKNIWINQLKKNKEIPFEDFTNIIETEYEYDYNADTKTQLKIDLINEKIENSNLVSKVIVKHSFEKGLREFNRQSQIPIATIQNHRDKFRKELWQEIEKKTKDLEM